MQVRRLDNSGPLGYCHDCHRRAAVEVTFGAGRPPLRLCARDVKYLVKHLTVALENSKKNHK